DTVAAQAPDVTAPAGILVAADGQVLWAREADSRRAMASTTKIMTAVVAIENASLDDRVTITSRATAVGEAAARLRPGADYPLRTLVEALLVRSGNDASVAVAEHVAGDVDRFVQLMNDKAEQLGLENTRFANPHGLDEAGHHTTAEDLATLARYAMANDEFRRMVAIEAMEIEGAGGVQELENSNLLIGTLEGATGVKTGFTGNAGFCLAASAQRDDVELFSVVLGAASEQERFQQSGLLLEWGFLHYGVRRLAESGEVIASVAVADYLDRSFDAVVGEPADLHVFDLAGEVTRVVRVPEHVEAPVARGERVGTLSFVQGGRLIGQAPLISVVDIRRPTLPERAWIALVRAWRSVSGADSVAEPAS
ncbi:MAG TPA: D-alanyl-D-alanine carboxypeptidase family protein, partial [Coriobacteriia bacterium]|nr:D-alanyl-D-alanine carboxypeptidase family protein [Coriobacteriia bacterium]